MTVTQTLMGAGSFNLRLSESTPQSVKDALYLLDHIVVTSQPLDLTAADADILAQADAVDGYVGIILGKPSDLDLEGTDISWWLGDASGVGPVKTSAIVKTSSTTSSWLDQIFPVNGIAKGSVTNGTSFDGVTSPYSTTLEVLNWICDQSDVEWQIRPDGTVDVAPSTTLFPAPTASSGYVVTRTGGANEGSLSGVQATALERARRAWNLISQVVIKYRLTERKAFYAAASTTPANVRWVDFDGAAPSDRTLRGDAWDVTGQTRAETIATRVLGRLSQDEREITVSSATHNVTAGRILPGERVWVYDKEAGFYDPTATTQVVYGGQTLAPIQMRCAAITWPVIQGMGVAARLNGGATWLDLMPYIEWEDGADVEWEITTSGFRRNRRPVALGTVVLNQSTGQESGGGSNAAVQNRSASSDVEGTWTPTWTNLTVGTGGSAANAGRWYVTAGEMRLQAEATLGSSGGSVSGGITVDLPSGWQVAVPTTGRVKQYGPCRIVANGTTYVGLVDCDGVTFTRLRVRVQNASGTYLTVGSTSATVPNTFGAGDSIDIDVTIPVERT